DALRQQIADLASRREGGGSILLISDGNDTTGQSVTDAAAAAVAANVRVHTVALGGSHAVQDLAITAYPMQPALIAGETGQIRVRLTQQGLAGAAVELTAGATVDAPLERVNIELTDATHQVVDLPVK